MEPVNMDWLATLMGMDDGMRVDDEYEDARMERNPAPSAIDELELRIERCDSRDVAENVGLSELFAIHWSRGSFQYTCQSETARHAYSWEDASKPPDLALWAAQFCLATPERNANTACAKTAAHRTYRMIARYGDGSVSKRSGTFSRDHLQPSKWEALLRELSALRNQRFPSQALDIDAFLYADSDGSAQYASVVFDGEKRSFYYINRLDDVRVGTRVRVPFGAENTERVGTVIEIRRYEAGEFPFPLHRTKAIIARVEPGYTSVTRRSP